MHSLQLGSHVDTCLLRCGKISYLFDPPQCSSCIHQNNSKRIRLTLSASLSFSFSSSFFFVFVVFIPRADMGVVYMRVLEKFGEFCGFVATGLVRFEHVRRRWVRRLWGEGSTVSLWHPGMCVRIHHVTKTRGARAGGKTNKGEFLRCHYRHKNCPRVVTGPENAVPQVERQHSDVALVLGGRVCVVVGNEDGNRQFFICFQ